MSIFYNQRQATLFNDVSAFSSSIEITKELSGLIVKTPYSKTFVEELKLRVPYQYRSWDGTLKVWRVAFAHAKNVCELVEEIYGFCPEVELSDEVSKFEAQTYLIEYVGRSKQREDGERLSMAYCQNNWNVIFPEKVLREWFEGISPDNDEENTQTPKESRKLTYYQLLGLKQVIEQSAIKKAYYRMAKQWHPDVCREPNARERFEAINQAYQILGQPIMRKRYDAGLQFEREAKRSMRSVNLSPKSQAKVIAQYGYAPPLRCGVVTMDGEYSISKIIVSKIHAWDDWMDGNGKTAIASWNMATMSIETVWI